MGLGYGKVEAKETDQLSQKKSYNVKRGNKLNNI